MCRYQPQPRSAEDHLLRTTNAIKERLDGFEKDTRKRFAEVNDRLDSIDSRLDKIGQDVRDDTLVLAHLAEAVAMIQDHLTKMPEIGDKLREAAHDLRKSLKDPPEESH